LSSLNKQNYAMTPIRAAVKKYALIYVKATVPLGGLLGVYIPWNLSQHPVNENMLTRHNLKFTASMAAAGAAAGPVIVPLCVAMRLHALSQEMCSTSM
jgi:hypothetical protein